MPTPGNKSQLALAELFEQEASYNLVHIRKRIQFFVLFAWIWIAVTVLRRPVAPCRPRGELTAALAGQRPVDRCSA